MVQFDKLQLVCIAGYCLNFSFKVKVMIRRFDNIIWRGPPIYIHETIDGCIEHSLNLDAYASFTCAQNVSLVGRQINVIFLSTNVFPKEGQD